MGSFIKTADESFAPENLSRKATVLVSKDTVASKCFKGLWWNFCEDYSLT